MVTLAIVFTLGTGLTARANSSGPAPINLGTAAFFAVLSKAGISNVPASSITGDMGVSPIASTAITGFSLVKDSSGTFATSAQVTGKVYAANYTAPTPSKMTTAIGNMQTAYVDAAGRSLPDYTELYGGNLSGQTLGPGLYKWSTGVVINSDVYLSGSSSDVWIFQISGNLTQASGTNVVLIGAQAKNIFWQVGGGVGVTINTTAHMEGTILALKAIHLLTGASLNGRLLAQTAVTLQQNTIVSPTTTPIIPPTTSMTFSSDGTLDGWVLESATGSGVGGSMNVNGTTFWVGDDAGNRQYRAILSFDTSGLPDTAVVTKVTLRIVRQSIVHTSPFQTLGKIAVDISQPYFDGSPALELADFQAPASLDNAGLISNGDYTVALSNTAAFPFINLVGLTQLRLRFQLATNNNNIANYIAFYRGNAINASSRPRLTVWFYVP
jgi:hypothetical protein